jgi:hypothetical protein
MCSTEATRTGRWILKPPHLANRVLQCDAVGFAIAESRRSLQLSAFSNERWRRFFGHEIGHYYVMSSPGVYSLPAGPARRGDEYLGARRRQGGARCARRYAAALTSSALRE